MSQNFVRCWENSNSFIDGKSIINGSQVGKCIQNKKYIKVELKNGLFVKIYGNPLEELLTWKREKGKNKEKSKLVISKRARGRKSIRQNPLMQQLSEDSKKKEYPLDGLLVKVAIERIEGHKYYGRIVEIVE